MPKPMRSLQEIERVCDKVVANAIGLIAEGGMDNLSMAKLGASLNMTAANVYNYYSNKDELVIAIHKQVFRELHETLLAALDGVDDPRLRLRSLARAFVSFGTANINVYEMMFTRPRRKYTDYVGTPLEEKAYAEYVSSMEPLLLASNTLDRCLGSELETARPPSVFALKLLSQIHGIISLFNSGILFEMTEDAEAVLHQIVEDTVNSAMG